MRMIPKIQKINVNYKFIHNTLQLQNYKDKKNASELIPEASIEILEITYNSL